jgi:HEAT repeat protein
MILDMGNQTVNVLTITESLHSPDPQIRLQTIAELKKLGIENAAELLISALDNADIGFQQILIATLLELGKSIIPVCINHIKTSSQSVRENIVKILSEISDSSYNLQVLNLLSDPDPLVRASAIEILGLLNDIWSISHIREFLKDSDARVRTKAVQALGNMRDTLSVDLLLQLLTDDSSDVKIAAIGTLAKLNEPRSCDSLWQVSTGDKDPQVRSIALQAIRTIGDNIINPYMGIFISNDVAARTDAVKKLSELGRCVILPLIECTKHAAASVREIAITILGNIGNDIASKRLIEASNDADPKVRVTALTALGKIHSETTLRYLLNCLRDLDPIIVSTATDVLVERGEEIVKFLPRILSEQDLNSQITVTRLIGKIQNPDLVNILAEYLSDSRMWIRRAVCFALGEIRNPLAANLLTEKCLFDQEALVRAAAAQALGKLKMPFVLDALLNALGDDEESVKNAVIKAIGELQITESGAHLLKFLSDESILIKITTIQTLAHLNYIGAIPQLKTMARSWPFGKETEEVRAQAKQALKILEQEKRSGRP